MQELTILEIQHRMASGELSAQAITESYLQRIAEIDRAGAALNSVIEINPDALDIAGALDAERQMRGARGLLHGVPILLKDNIDTGDRMMTTAGSLALAGESAPQDATVAQRLREAGAVILGKTNLSEWANFRSNRSVSGWSSRGGQTRNPYALDRDPCGSSSGSAAAVAANLCAASIGTETDGSIICPSHMCGIVGLKPTLGLISRAGIVPIAHSQDTAGPMAGTVADVAAMLGPLAGPDPRDSATAGSEGHVHRDYTRFLDRDGLRGARIGVARNFFGSHPQVDHIMEQAIIAMSAAGAEIVDPANLEIGSELNDSEMEVLLYEFKADLNAYLAGRGPGASVHSLEDVIAFNEGHRDLTMPYFGQELLLRAQQKGPLTEEAYLRALATNHRLTRAEGIDAVLASLALDAIIAPSGGPAWLVDYVNGDRDENGTTSPAAVAGYPSITVSAGDVWGLPIGISFIAAAYAEPVLLRLAYAFEQATQARRPPEFKPSVQFTEPRSAT